MSPIGVMEPTNHSPGRRSPREDETGAVHPAATHRRPSTRSCRLHPGTRTDLPDHVPFRSTRIASPCWSSAVTRPGPSTLAAMPPGIGWFRVLCLRSRDLPEGAGHRGEFVKVAEAFLRGCGLPCLFDHRQPDIRRLDSHVVPLICVHGTRAGRRCDGKAGVCRPAGGLRGATGRAGAFGPGSRYRPGARRWDPG